jgi:hypothetical protein
MPDRTGAGKSWKQSVTESPAKPAAIAKSPNRTEAGVAGTDRRVDVHVMIGPPAGRFPGQSDRRNLVSIPAIGPRLPAFLPVRLGGLFDARSQTLSVM